MLGAMSLQEARKALCSYMGVGPKVADCILLFTGARQDVFPVDVWVKRVMEELYFGRSASVKEIDAFAAEHFGKMCGLAQQYLFYFAREHMEELRNMI
jgi:N-glycosylase/DNA lyase